MPTILPLGKTTFADGNNSPLAAGTVNFYVPGTTTPKSTYQDSAGTIANANPVVLDSHGQASVWGSGAYRQIVKSAAGVTIWDQVVTAPGGGAAGGGSGWYNVKDSPYNAMGDGVTDDTVAVQACLTAALVTGGTVYFPHGEYKITGSGLSINQTAQTTFSTLNRISLVGDGPGNTKITYTGSGSCLTYTGSAANGGSATSALLNIEKLQFYGPATTGASYGLNITLAAYWAMRDVLVWNFHTGVSVTDTLSWVMDRCTVILNAHGIDAQFGTFSPPNAITWNGCTIGLNTIYGAQVTQPACVTITGGSIESNGTSAAGFGIAIQTPGTDGGVGVTFTGVYFENNAKDADIIVNANTAGTIPSSINVIGCLFNRDSTTQVVTNNIQVNSSTGYGAIKLNTFGCGFRGFPTYTPDAGRPYIGINQGGGIIDFVGIGNTYASTLEAPSTATIAGPRVGREAIATARSVFNWTGAAIAISANLNVATITRSSAGVYVVAFSRAMDLTSFAPQVGMTNAGFISVSAVTTAGFTMTCADSATSAIDPGSVWFTVFGGMNA